jgi:hypothetical protein
VGDQKERLKGAQHKVGRCRLTLSKPTSKGTGTQRLKLEYGRLLSSFALNFNLRRYNKMLDLLNTIGVSASLLRVIDRR